MCVLFEQDYEGEEGQQESSREGAGVTSHSGRRSVSTHIAPYIIILCVLCRWTREENNRIMHIVLHWAFYHSMTLCNDCDMR